MNKKALSPVIATVLLISLVVVLALIIFLWATSFITEVVEKEGKSASQACGEISLQASLSGSTLSLVNQGNIPVYQIEIVKKSGFKEERQVEQVDVKAGESKTDIEVTGSFDKVEIIPAILGKSGNVQKIFTCVDNPVSV
mgnify:CR=1 FL=1